MSTHKGHPCSEATKLKLSLIEKGRVNVGKHHSPTTEFKKGQHPSPNTELVKGNQLHKGYHFSDESKLKMSEANKINHPRTITNCEHCGKEISLTKYDVEHQHHHFCDDKCKHFYFSGEHNNKWRGGITPYNKQIRQSNEYKDWRKAVFERDDYTCQICKERGGQIHAHHKQEFSIYSLFRLDLDNGITLCKSCHDKLHRDCSKIPRNKKGQFTKVIQYYMF